MKMDDFKCMSVVSDLQNSKFKLIGLNISYLLGKRDDFNLIAIEKKQKKQY